LIFVASVALVFGIGAMAIYQSGALQSDAEKTATASALPADVVPAKTNRSDPNEARAAIAAKTRLLKPNEPIVRGPVEPTSSQARSPSAPPSEAGAKDGAEALGIDGEPLAEDPPERFDVVTPGPTRAASPGRPKQYPELPEPYWEWDTRPSE
jgi:hypothetical protein